MNLVVPLKLHPSPEQSELLRRTLHAVNAATQRAAEVSLENDRPNCYTLHKLVYRELKDEFSLGAQAACRVLGKATQAVANLKPTQTAVGIRLDGAFPFEAQRMFSIRAGIASLWTLSGRAKVAFSLNPGQQDLLDDARHLQSDLRVTREGVWYLDLAVEVEVPPLAEVSEFTGVDLGLANIAVASDGDVFGGGQVERLRAKHAKVRKSYQKTNTRKARKRLRRISGRQKRFQSQENHRISRRLVDAAKARGKGIALEDLKGIRGNSGRRTVGRELKARLGNWGFSQLRQFVSYKAERAGVVVEVVKAAFTSQTCSRCDHCDEGNRPTRGEFCCLHCGLSVCADLNAARNIASRANQTLGESRGGGERKPPREGPRAKVLEGQSPRL